MRMLSEVSSQLGIQAGPIRTTFESIQGPSGLGCRWGSSLAPKIPVSRALWSLLAGIWGGVKGSWGVLILLLLLGS